MAGSMCHDESGQTSRAARASRTETTSSHRARTRTGYVAYVPLGTPRGESGTTGGGGKTLQCNVCHGPDLKGLGNVPRIAGLSPTYVFRQLFDMQAGTRNGAGAALMKAAVAKLNEEDMVSLAAYLGSLAP